MKNRFRDRRDRQEYGTPLSMVLFGVFCGIIIGMLIMGIALTI